MAVDAKGNVWVAGIESGKRLKSAPGLSRNILHPRRTPDPIPWMNLENSMKAGTIFSVLVVIMTWSIVAGMWSPFPYGENLLRGQAARSTAAFPQDPYVKERAARADTVPRITTKFHVDPWWPKPLPNDWVFGAPVGVCTDSKDHVFIVERTDAEAAPWQGNTYGPPVLELDPGGNLVSSWGDPSVLPATVGDCCDCYVDSADNIWLGGSNDGIAQKYSHDGKLLLQIGAKGKFDTSDGTAKGKALNASQTLLNKPSAIAADPANGDVYIADGMGNRRVVVFDRSGKFIRQFGRQATKEEAETGVGGAFTAQIDNLVLSNDGLLYVGERDGKRIQVFDKTGNFKKNISVPRRRRELQTQVYHREGLEIAPTIPDKAEIFGVLLSRDKAQKYLYVGTPEGLIWTVERESGKPISAFGQRGYSTGEIRISGMAINSNGDLIVVAANRGIQKFKAVGED